MKITEAQLRRIIREELIREAPLGGGERSLPLTPYRQHEENPIPDFDPDVIYQSVGYTDADKNRPEAVELFSEIPENWDIIPIDDIENVKALVNSVPFRAEIERRKYPPGTKILVVGTPPFGGDYTETKWAIRHDIIGHTIDRAAFSGELGEIYRNSNKYYSDLRRYTEKSVSLEDDQRQPVNSPEFSIWKSLPEESQLGSTGDIFPDIYASIFFGEITEEDIEGIIRRFLRVRFDDMPREGVNEIASKYADDLVSKVELWKKSIKPGINIIRLW